MKLKNSYFFTLRENIKEEDSISGNLLVRSGMIKKTSSGVYMFLPLGLKVMNIIKKIISEEMNKINSLEVSMPALISEETFIKSKRREYFGPDMFSFDDRFGKKYVLGPTHEELFTIAASYKIKSYKDLHFFIHQFQTKFRDEPRPRYGLLRVREFIMKDAYSFDANEEGLDVSYNEMYKAYKNIFDRLKLNYAIVASDTGAMGGTLSEEFQALCNIGEDTLITCPKCSYASNNDIAKAKKHIYEKETPKEKEEIHTPDAKTIEEISTFLNEKSYKFIKTLIYKSNNELYAVLINGNYEVNETKLKKLLKVTKLELATEEEIQKLDTTIGFVGPINLGIKIVMDEDIKEINNLICGANKKDYHIKNVNYNVDFTADFIGDIKQVKEGDLCPICGEKLQFSKGIEVGNIFKIGTKYSEAFNLTYLDEQNKTNPVVMGCYGIGLGRCMASVVEQHYDDNGIIWPMEIAPYKVSIVLIDPKDKEQSKNAEELYNKLNELNIDTILDDRDERPGIKFNDMDLIGIPIRVVVGSKSKDNIYELKLRNSNDVFELSQKELIEKIQQIISQH